MPDFVFKKNFVSLLFVKGKAGEIIETSTRAKSIAADELEKQESADSAAPQQNDDPVQVLDEKLKQSQHDVVQKDDHSEQVSTNVFTYAEIVLLFHLSCVNCQRPYPTAVVWIFCR